MEVDKLKDQLRPATIDTSQESLPSATRNNCGIIAGYSIYHEAKHLRASLESICDYADALFVLMGRTKGSPNTKSDGSFDIVSSVAKRFDPKFTRSENSMKIMVYLCDPVTDTQKRNYLFTLVKPGNYLLLMEPNEILVGDVKGGFEHVKSNQEKSIFWVQNKVTKEWLPKIIKINPGLHYPTTRSKVKDPYSILDRDSRSFVERNDWFNVNNFTDGIISDFEFEMKV